MNLRIKILAALILFASINSSFADFKSEGVRYLAPHDFNALLMEVFSLSHDPASPSYLRPYDAYLGNISPRLCFYTGKAQSYGFLDPKKGLPSHPEPEIEFFRLVFQCIEIAFHKEKKVLDPSQWLQKYSPQGKKITSPWLSYTLAEKLNVIEPLVLRLIGPDPVIRDFGYATGVRDLSTQIIRSIPLSVENNLNPHDSFEKAILTAIKAIWIREEFLRY